MYYEKANIYFGRTADRESVRQVPRASDRDWICVGTPRKLQWHGNITVYQ